MLPPPAPPVLGPNSPAPALPLRPARLASLAVLVAAGVPAAAQEPLLTAYDGPYSLARPVPRERMRELSADRPDATESPITVDAGHAQLEASLADWSKDSGDETFLALALNAKVGLTESTDLQLVVDTYSRFDAARGDDVEGTGDVQLRYKWNLFGNDGGGSALALFPYVEIPTDAGASDGEWEGGLMLPYSRDLAEGVSLGLMAGLDLVAPDDDGDHDLELLHTAVLGFDVTERVGTFVEYAGVLAEDDYLAAFDTGVTLAVHADLVLDAGIRVGLTREAEDFGAFVGFTARH